MPSVVSIIKLVAVLTAGVCTSGAHTMASLSRDYSSSMIINTPMLSKLQSHIHM